MKFFVFLFASFMAGVQSQRTLRAAVIANQAFLHRSPDADATGNDRYDGYIKDLLNAVADITDFNFDMVESEDQRYGARDENGRWSGMVGMVQSNKADVIAADLTMTDVRMEVLDFSVPFMANSLTVLVQKSSNTFVMCDFYSVFSHMSWLAILVAFLVTSAVLWLVLRINPEEKKRKEGQVVESIPGAMWYLFSFFFRGAEFSPRAISSRLLVSAWWLFSLAVFVTYVVHVKGFIGGGNLTAGDSVEDLLARSDFKFGVVSGGSTYRFLSTQTGNVHAAIYDRIKENPLVSLVPTYAEGVSRMKERNDLGLILEESGADFYKGKDCSLESFGNFHAAFYSFAFKKGSSQSLLNQFNKAILQLGESGKLDEIRSRWWPDMCSGSASEKDTQNIFDLSTPLIFLAILLVLSLVVSLLELFLESRRDNDVSLGQTLRDAVSGPTPKEKEQVKGENEPLNEEKA